MVRVEFKIPVENQGYYHLYFDFDESLTPRQQIEKFVEVVDLGGGVDVKVRWPVETRHGTVLEDLGHPDCEICAVAREMGIIFTHGS